MPISETCTAACAARIDLLPSMPLKDARKFISEWRLEHKHYDGPPVKEPAPFGFNLNQVLADAVSNDFNDGEQEIGIVDPVSIPDSRDDE